VVVVLKLLLLKQLRLFNLTVLCPLEYDSARDSQLASINTRSGGGDTYQKCWYIIIKNFYK